MFTYAMTIALMTVSWQPTGFRWNSNQLPVPYCISANATNTSISAANQRRAVLDGINVWVATNAGGSMSCTSYRASNATFQCSVGVDVRDRRPNIFWERNWRQGSRTIGVTWSVNDGTSCGSVTDDTGTSTNLLCFWDADIELNDVNFTWDTSGRSNTTDIASIMAHEYGHFIGLDHCNNNNTCQLGSAIMYAAYAGGALRVPFADDVQGACALYPGTLGGTGSPCAGAGDCSSGICINVNGDQYCTETCGTCPTGFRCGPNPNNAAQQVCLRDNGLNRAVCETCIGGATNACLNNGLCVAGIPEQNQGRCVEPCGAGNTCDPQFRCLAVTLQDGSIADYCFPRSSDCTDLSNFATLQLGQRCDNDPPCADGLVCVGICAPDCTDNGMCPNEYGCELFQNGRSYCLPLVDEGSSCEGLVSCRDGFCLLNENSNQFQCYRDCEGNPAACNNAQSCNEYPLQNLTLRVCEPPGVPPLPPDAGVFVPDAASPDAASDAGVPDASDPPDLGFTPNTCSCDLTFDCDPDDQTPGTACRCDPECTCACDRTFACDQDNGQNCACDPECNCACDTTYSCDQVNGQACACDPECFITRSTGCTCATARRPWTPWISALLVAGFMCILRRRRVA